MEYTKVEESKESEVFETIKRTQIKLSHLREVLSPVMNSVLSKAQEKGNGTRLSTELHSIEDNLTDLLDSISF